MNKFLILIVFSVFSFGFTQPKETVESPPPSQVLVIFGAYGDLAKRQLFPALVELKRKERLAKDFTLIGVGRKDLDQESFFKEVSPFIPEASLESWNELKSQTEYQSGTFEDPATYSRIAESLKEKKGNRTFYLSTPPSSFLPIIEQLHVQGLLNKGDLSSRIIIEKPFGRDTQSAIELQEKIAQFLDERQIFRMDHFLGKEVVRQLLDFRFSNPSIESLWNGKEIESVTITVSESIGIENRAKFWEQTGMLRDIVQNHIMQIVSLVGMEKPSDFESQTIQKEKQRLIEAIRPFSKEGSKIQRGQYIGYREEAASPESSRETYVEATLLIDNARWKGVPFFIKAGKRLSKKYAEIDIQFKQTGPHAPNHLRLRIQPDPEIRWDLNIDQRVRSISFPFEKGQPGAYEQLLIEAMAGEQTHFVSYNELIASWNLFTPVLQDWEEHPPQDFPNYAAGSDGPATPLLQPK